MDGAGGGSPSLLCVLMQQAELRNTVVQSVAAHLRDALTRHLAGAPAFHVRLYGSLHHGLHVPTHSKVCLDVFDPAATAASRENLLHVLAGNIVRESDTIRHPVLVWNRTATRPLVLRFFYGAHVTVNNHSGLEASAQMAAIIFANPSLHAILYDWKQRLVGGGGDPLLGPNDGQVSSYVLVLLAYDCYSEALRAGVIRSDADADTEPRLRDLVAARLAGHPRPLVVTGCGGAAPVQPRAPRVPRPHTGAHHGARLARQERVGTKRSHSMPVLLLLCILQTVLLLFMHYVAVRRNLALLRRYVASHDADREPDTGDLWVRHADGTGFRLCAACVWDLTNPQEVQT